MDARTVPVDSITPVASFVDHAAAALREGTFVRLLLSQPVDSGPKLTERIIARLIRVRGELVLSATWREATRDTTKNLGLDAVPDWLTSLVPGEFRSAVLETTERTWQLLAARDGRIRLVGHKPAQTTAPDRSHDRAKSRFLGRDARPWLVQLGVCTAEGAIRASMADKHRQIERYLEILSHLAAECGWHAGDAVPVVDMGSGKGYLTFGVWHLLTRRLGLRAEVRGIEVRQDLVDRTNAAARAIDAVGLTFSAGTIADATVGPVRALIALHACNTATDDALRRGVEAGAQLILLSPCCHQELRPQLRRPDPIAPILAHGIMAERFSEWLTDGLRALHLERAGYDTKLIEFVSSEHTPRNLLLAAVRRTVPDPAARERATAEIQRLKAWAGIEHQALDDLLAG